MARSQVDQAAVAQVLEGRRSYDDLGQLEQAVVRDVWSDRMTQLRDNIDFAADFAAGGEPYSEADASGNVIIIRPD